MKLKSLTTIACLLLAAAVAWAGEAPNGATQEIPEGARKRMLHALGDHHVYRDKVQEELKLSDDQKRKLREKLPEFTLGTEKVKEKLKDLKGEERIKEWRSHSQNYVEKMDAFLNETLNAEQYKRFQQLELQHEGSVALTFPEMVKELKITDEQLKQLGGVVQDLGKQIGLLTKEAQSGGKPEEIHPKALKMRKDHDDKSEAILSDTQREQWKRMLGKPFDLGVLLFP